MTVKRETFQSPLVSVFGLGMGGFFDGILLHQVVQ
jgi:uncharacterized membrane protein